MDTHTHSLDQETKVGEPLAQGIRITEIEAMAQVLVGAMFQA